MLGIVDLSVTVTLLLLFERTYPKLTAYLSPDRHLADIFDVRGVFQVSAEGAQGGALGVLAVLQGSASGQHHDRYRVTHQVDN